MGLKENLKQAAQELMLMPGIKTEGAKEPKAKAPTPVAEPSPQIAAPRRQHTIIAEGDEIHGDLKCTGDLELYGTITGNITGSGSLKLCGTLTGDAEGAAVEVRGSFIKGNISAAGRVEVDSAATVLGNVKAQALTLSGKIRGDVDIAEGLTLAETAVVLGKISTGRITVAEGALFRSEVTIPSVDFDLLFRKTEQPDV